VKKLSIPDFIALAEPVSNFPVITMRAEYVSPAAPGFNGRRRTGIATRGQQCGGQPVLRRPSGMEALRHGPEHFAQADRLRRR